MLAFLLVLLTSGARGVSADELTTWSQEIAKACGDEHRACVTFAALAIEEGGFWEPVLSGKCNDPAWRKKQRGSWAEDACDQGIAAGPWQVHAADVHASPADLRNPVKGTRLAWDYFRRAPGAWPKTLPRAQARALRWLTRHPLP